MEFGNDKQAAKKYIVESAANKVFKEIDRSLTANQYWRDKYNIRKT